MNFPGGCPSRLLINGSDGEVRALDCVLKKAAFEIARGHEVVLPKLLEDEEFMVGLPLTEVKTAELIAVREKSIPHEGADLSEK